ncbi:MAG: hypothetical protein AAB074_18140 [Planctomycetota bacterium]
MLRACFLSLAIVFAVAAPAAAQCSMCKESLKEEEAAPLALGFKVTIYGMIATPFLLTAGIILMILRSDKQAAARRRAASQATA